MPFSDVVPMRHLTVDILSGDPQSFNIDVNPSISVGELRDIITFHFNELFLFSKLGQIASISCRGKELPWAMLVAGLNQIDTIEVHLKRVWGAKEVQRGPEEEKAKATVISYDQPRVGGSETTPGASSSPDLERDSSSPGLLEKVKSLEVKSDSEIKTEYVKTEYGDVKPDNEKVAKLNRFKFHRSFAVGSPILFITLASDHTSSWAEAPLGLFLDPAFDAKERKAIQLKRSRLRSIEAFF